MRERPKIDAFFMFFVVEFTTLMAVVIQKSLNGGIGRIGNILYNEHMNKKQIIALVFAGILLLLGLLWFLQGSDLVPIKPILCFANCQPITGKSTTWQIIGGACFMIGLAITYINLKRYYSKKVK